MGQRLRRWLVRAWTRLGRWLAKIWAKVCARVITTRIKVRDWWGGVAESLRQRRLPWRRAPPEPLEVAVRPLIAALEPDWREVLAKRNRTSKTKRLYEDGQPTNKHSWDGIVGTSLHYEEAGEWLEVDPRIVPSSEPGWDWEMCKSHWRFLMRNGGWFAAEKKGVGIGFRLERIAYLNIQTKEYQTIRTADYTTPTVEVIEHGNALLANPLGKLTWANLFPGVDFEIHVSGDRLHEEIKVSQAARDAMPAPPYPAAETYLVMVYEVDWGQVPGLADDDGDISYDQDFEHQGRLYLKNHQSDIITALPASKAWPEGRPVDENGEPIEVPLRKRFVKIAGQHYLLMGAPILALNALPQGTIIFDPDVDVQIGANADDDMVVRETSTAWYNTGSLRTGNKSTTQYGYGGSFRLTGVDIPAGVTVTVANTVFTCASSKSTTTVNSDLCCENASNPGQMANYEDHIGRSRTTAVAWDNIGAWTLGAEYTTPDFASCVQTVVDDNAGTGDALIVFWEDKDLESSTGAARYAYAHDVDSSKAAQLHIEYTAAAGGLRSRYGVIGSPIIQVAA